MKAQQDKTTFRYIFTHTPGLAPIRDSLCECCYFGVILNKRIKWRLDDRKTDEASVIWQNSKKEFGDCVMLITNSI